jgi:FtsP/CotA-like multicopper oxidase with cupredoxin domain
MMGMEPPVNNIIINGRHITNCSNPPTEFPFVPDIRDDGDGDDDEDNSNETSHCSGGSIFATRVKGGDSVRLRLISHSSNMPYWFTVDSHALDIVEMDGVEIEPITTSRIFMNPGQRYSVILKADQTAGNYLMRAEVAKGCGMISRDKVSGLASIDFQATAIMSYDDVSEEELPIGQPWALEESSNAVLGREPWSEKCQEMPFDSSKPMRKMAAYEVGEKNSHYFTFDMMRSNDMGLLTRINEVSADLNPHST